LAATHFYYKYQFTKIEPGKHQVEGVRIFFISLMNIKQNQVMKRLEAHKKYIDIHVVISGSEQRPMLLSSKSF
jgi:YhcH/YjgK/YiaL family protein